MNDITAIPSAFQSATNTIRQSQDNVDKDAAVVANSGTVDAHETVDALVDSHQQVLYTKAAAQIIRATDAMTKTLLDVHA